MIDILPQKNDVTSDEPSIDTDSLRALPLEERQARLNEFRALPDEDKALWRRLFSIKGGDIVISGSYEQMPDGSERKIIDKEEKKLLVRWMRLQKRYGNPPGFIGTVVASTEPTVTRELTEEEKIKATLEESNKAIEDAFEKEYNISLNQWTRSKVESNGKVHVAYLNRDKTTGVLKVVKHRKLIQEGGEYEIPRKGIYTWNGGKWDFKEPIISLSVDEIEIRQGNLRRELSRLDIADESARRSLEDRISKLLTQNEVKEILDEFKILPVKTVGSSQDLTAPANLDSTILGTRNAVPSNHSPKNGKMSREEARLEKERLLNLLESRRISHAIQKETLNALQGRIRTTSNRENFANLQREIERFKPYETGRPLRKEFILKDGIEQEVPVREEWDTYPPPFQKDTTDGVDSKDKDAQIEALLAQLRASVTQTGQFPQHTDEDGNLTDENVPLRAPLERFLARIGNGIARLFGFGALSEKRAARAERSRVKEEMRDEAEQHFKYAKALNVAADERWVQRMITARNRPRELTGVKVAEWYLNRADEWNKLSLKQKFGASMLVLGAGGVITLIGAPMYMAVIPGLAMRAFGSSVTGLAAARIVHKSKYMNNDSVKSRAHVPALVGIGTFCAVFAGGTALGNYLSTWNTETSVSKPGAGVQPQGPKIATPYPTIINGSNAGTVFTPEGPSPVTELTTTPAPSTPSTIEVPTDAKVRFSSSVSFDATSVIAQKGIDGLVDSQLTSANGPLAKFNFNESELVQLKDAIRRTFVDNEKLAQRLLSTKVDVVMNGDITFPDSGKIDMKVFSNPHFLESLKEHIVGNGQKGIASTKSFLLPKLESIGGADELITTLKTAFTVRR